MVMNCLVCSEIEKIKADICPDLIAELETGYAVLGWHQFYKGYTIFFCKEHKTELHELDHDFKIKFLEEMSQAAEAVFKAFGPQKMNYELLGNSESHMHWHLFPRHADDPRPLNPVWVIDESVRRADSVKPSPEQLAEYKQRIFAELEKIASIEKGPSRC